MYKEYTKTASTVDEAISLALTDIKNDLGETPFTYEVITLETPKKKLFGGFKGEAVVKLIVNSEDKPEKTINEAQASTISDEENMTKLDVALKYVDDVINALNLEDISYEVKKDGENVTIILNGSSIGVLIGHHGETLDALQYLIALSCSRTQGDYFRITLDGGNYRQKREATLKELAQKISEKVKRTNRSQSLEPMNPYERRIIHAVVAEVPGVFSKSKGEDPNRRVIIISENANRSFNKNNNSGSNNYNRPNNRNNTAKREKANTPSPVKYEKGPSIEEMLKNDKKANDDSKVSAKLYSKIEL